MTDVEIMAAIGAGFETDDERPALTKTKRSFLQKLTERHGALKLHMRSIRGDDPDCDEHRGQSRTSSSSSVQKDFFKVSPTVWTKPDRTRNDFATRYDDIEDGPQPSPTTVLPSPVSPNPGFASSHTIAQSDRQLIRDFVSSELTSVDRQHSSHSFASATSPCASPLQSPRSLHFVSRSRSVPNAMSDEEMDAWLEKPEDAEVHRQRKLSARTTISSVLSSRQRSVTVPETSADRKEMRRKYTIPRKQIASPRPSLSDPGLGAGVREESKAARSSADVEMTLSQGTNSTASEDCLRFSALPDEVLLEIARHLDMKSVARCRLTSKKLYDTVPAPLRPLAPKKT